MRHGAFRGRRAARRVGVLAALALRPPGTKHTTVCAVGARGVGAGKLQTSEHDSNNKAFAAGVIGRFR